jgi:DNA-binding MarR family transcriptional regulator
VSERIVDDAERSADLFVLVLEKTLTGQVLEDDFDGHVTSSQLLALRYLALNEQPLMSDLADGLGISYPAATKTVERLVKKGLAAREDDPMDRRVVRVNLTKDGMRLVRRILAEKNARFHRILQNMRAEDRQALLGGVEAFVTVALETMDTDNVAAAICLHCGAEHSPDCTVEATLARKELAKPSVG